MPPRPVPPPRAFFDPLPDEPWHSAALRSVDDLAADADEQLRAYGLRKAAVKLAEAAHHIDAYMRAEGLSQRRLAEQVGVPHTVISDFLTGGQWVQVHNLLRLLGSHRGRGGVPDQLDPTRSAAAGVGRRPTPRA